MEHVVHVLTVFPQDRAQQRLVEQILIFCSRPCPRTGFSSASWRRDRVSASASWRASGVDGGCACGHGCTFAHSWAELHPGASAHEHELASHFVDWGVRGLASPHSIPGCHSLVILPRAPCLWLFLVCVCVLPVEYRYAWLHSGYMYIRQI